MSQLSIEQQKYILEALAKKGADAPCPRCSGEEFTILDQLAAPFVPNLQAPFGLPKKNYPMVLIFCDNCGFTSQHLVGLLVSLDEFEALK